MNKNRSSSFASQDTVLRGFTFSFYMTVAIITTYFPLYFGWRGFSTIQIGLLYSVGPMIGIAANLFWGFMSDKFRTVKKVLSLILLGQLILALLMFRTDSFGLLMVLMAVFFFFQTPMSSLNDSLTLLNASRTGKSYASYRVWGSIGFAAAAFAFGQLMKLYGTGLTAVLGIATISLSLLLSFALTDAREANYKKPDFSGLLPIIGSRSFLAFLLIVLTLSIAHRMNDGFLALFMQRLGAPPSLIGLSWMASAVSEIPVFFLLSRFGHKFKEPPLLVICCLVYVVRFLLMSRVENPLWVIAIQVMHSLSFGIFYFTVIRYIQSVVPDQFRATGQAVFAVTWSGLAGLLSGLLGGWLFNDWGPHFMYGVGSVLALIAMLGFLLLHARTKAGVEVELEAGRK
ncbi:MFS transporter [Paenibacillus sp. P25]|nr:MFS transporter [Paenibacillus sp. P25]